MEYSNLFVCLLGVGTVFMGLISIIVICKVMGFLCRGFGEKKDNKESVSITNPDKHGETVTCKDELVAAISAAIAEDLGKDIKAIKILSIRKI